jgi:hypothetical protein
MLGVGVAQAKRLTARVDSKYVGLALTVGANRMKSKRGRSSVG